MNENDKKMWATIPIATKTIFLESGKKVVEWCRKITGDTCIETLENGSVFKLAKQSATRWLLIERVS